MMLKTLNNKVRWFGVRFNYTQSILQKLFQATPIMALLVVGCGSGDTSTGLVNTDDLEFSNIAAAPVSDVEPVINVSPESDVEPVVGVAPLVDMTPVVTVGDVRTVEVEGVVFTSLPDSNVDTDRASVQLGRLLFWDPILSGDRDVACGTCHLPEFGYADGLQRAIGTGGVGAGPNRVPGQVGVATRNSQSVVNTVWNGINEFGVFDTEEAPMFWDNRTTSLASQALEPIRSQVEMRGNNFTETEIDEVVISRLSANADYQMMFERAFGSSTISLEAVGQALSDFQSTLIANDAPFDRWMRGDTSAMNNQQLQGLRVFAQTGCANCHSGAMFSDYETHVLGVREAANLNEPDAGDGNFGFRTPTLRQLAFTAPYFHGGQENTLNEVIRFYDRPNGSDNPNVANNQLDPDFSRFPSLNNDQVNAIEAFLDALNDGDFDQSRPDSVPSGLPVGGAL